MSQSESCVTAPPSAALRRDWLQMLLILGGLFIDLFIYFLQTPSTGIPHPGLCPRLTSFQKQFSPPSHGPLGSACLCGLCLGAGIPPEGSCSCRDGSPLSETQTRFFPGQEILKCLTRQETALRSARVALERCTAPPNRASNPK